MSEPASLALIEDCLSNIYLSRRSPGEARALAAEREFLAEIKRWNGLNASTFADHLTDKYLCCLLDPLPSSTAVKAARTRVANKIEELLR